MKSKRSSVVDQRTPVGRVTSRILSDGSLTKRASLNAVASGVDQGARTVANLLITPFLVTRLGDSVFGIWKVLQGLISQATPATGRPAEALKWTVAHHNASTDYEQKRYQVGNAVAVWFLFLPLLLVVGAGLAWFSPMWLGAEQSSYAIVRLAAALLVVDLIISGLAFLPQSVLQGENLGYKRLGLSTSLVFVARTMMLIAVYLGLGIVGLAVATVVTTALSGAVYLHIVRSQVPWFGIAQPSFSAVRRFAGLSSWFLLWNLINQVMRAGDLVVLGIAASPALATTYALARFVPQTITVVAAMTIVAIMPGLGGLIGAKNLERAARIRDETMSLIWLLTTVLGAAVLLWGESFLRVWVGERYYPGTLPMLLIILMVLQLALIRTDANIIDLTLNLRGKVLLGGVATALSVGLAWLLLSTYRMGIVGLALGFIIGRAILTVGYPWMIGRLLNIAPKRQLAGAIRPMLTTAVLFASASALSLVVAIHSWVTLILLGALSTGVLAVFALFAGLQVEPRRRVSTRLMKVAKLT
jgi:O-antigen/teichoic acid export membrane protein